MINMELQLAIENDVEITDLFGDRADSNKNQIMSVLRQMKPKESFVLPRLNLRNTANQAGPWTQFEDHKQSDAWWTGARMVDRGCTYAAEKSENAKNSTGPQKLLQECR